MKVVWLVERWAPSGGWCHLESHAHRGEHKDYVVKDAERYSDMGYVTKEMLDDLGVDAVEGVLLAAAKRRRSATT